MLNSILVGKAGRLETTEGVPESWRDALRANEDIVTATIFERLTYLPGSVTWDILRRTFRGGLAPYRIAELENVIFWPRWGERARGTVEPDVFLRWRVGDPSKRIDLIVEAKKGKTGQNSYQWFRQQVAYLGWMEEESDQVEETFFLAIGGMGDNPREKAVELSAGVKKLAGTSDPMNALAADWSDLAAALYKTETNQIHAKYLVDDMAKALSEFGYRHFEISDDLLSVYPLEEANGAIINTLEERILT